MLGGMFLKGVEHVKFSEREITGILQKKYLNKMPLQIKLLHGLCKGDNVKNFNFLQRYLTLRWKMNQCLQMNKSFLKLYKTITKAKRKLLNIKFYAEV